MMMKISPIASSGFAMAMSTTMIMYAMTMPIGTAAATVDSDSSFSSKIHIHPGLYPMVKPTKKKDRDTDRPSSLRRRRTSEEVLNNDKAVVEDESSSSSSSSSSRNTSCTLHKSLYFGVGSGYLWMDGDFVGQQGTAYGGQAPFYDSAELEGGPDAMIDPVAQYTWYTRFMYSEADGVGPNGLHEGQVLTCMGGGTYTFEEEEEEEEPEEEGTEVVVTKSTEESTSSSSPSTSASPPTFRLLDSITWQASCANYPYFTITGGQGKYLGVQGYIETFIPSETGFRHDIYTC